MIGITDTDFFVIDCTEEEKNVTDRVLKGRAK